MPDFVAIRDGLCLLTDYKTGRIKVANAASNRQLMWLAVLINHKYKVEEITTSIIQPYCGPPTSFTYDKAALKKARTRVNLVLRRMEDKSATLRPGEKQCKYCKAKELCPALNKKMTALQRVTDVTALTPVQLKEALDVIPAVRALCTTIEQRAHTMLEENPSAIPQYALSSGKTTRRVKSPQIALERLLGSDLVDTAGFVQSCSVGLTRLQKHVQEYSELGPSDARKAINTALANEIEEKQGKAKLCRQEFLEME